MMTVQQRFAISLLPVGFLILAACATEMSPPGPEQTDTRSVDLDNSELARVQLRMGAGELSVRGGSAKLMDGEFTYTRLALKPEIHYDSSGFRGNLVIAEPSGIHHSNNGKYLWDLRLNDEKPLDLEVDFGAGEGRLDLGSLNLKSVDVKMGVGSLRLDLRGNPHADYSVHVRGGIGEATIYLPEGVGVVAEAQGGIGDINARGLSKRDGRYTNQAYGRSKTTIRLDIHGGIGAINLVGS